MRRILTSALLLLVVSAVPFQLFAQEVPLGKNPGSAENVDQLTSCFDYYRFGSTPIIVSSETVRVSQGAELQLTAKLVNENDYPLDNVSIYSKIFYKKNFDKSSFGPDVVDRFVMAENINLKAGETKTIAYTWKVPANIQPGFYQVGSYVASHDRFNFAGLSFSNDVVGNLFNFSIAGEDMGSVRFDNTQIMLNGSGYHTAIFPPRSDRSTEGVPVAAIIANTTSVPFEGTIHWKLYSWDSLNEENLIEESTTPVSISANASTTVEYAITNTDHTVYYLMGVLQSTTDTTPLSMISVRYVMTSEGNDIARLAFVGANGYPSVDGETMAIACINSTGSSPSDDIRLELTTKPLDLVSWILNLGSLGKGTYEGDAPGQVSAFSIPMTAASGNFAVTATLYQQGILMDSVTAEYSCEDFGGSCTTTTTTQWIIAAAVLVILVALIIGIVVLIRRRRATSSSGTISSSL